MTKKWEIKELTEEETLKRWTKTTLGYEGVMTKELSKDDLKDIEDWEDLCLYHLTVARKCVERIQVNYNLKHENLTIAIDAAIAAAKGE